MAGMVKWLTSESGVSSKKDVKLAERIGILKGYKKFTGQKGKGIGIEKKGKKLVWEGREEKGRISKKGKFQDFQRKDSYETVRLEKRMITTSVGRKGRNLNFTVKESESRSGGGGK